MKIDVIIAICAITFFLLIIPTKNRPSVFKNKRKLKITIVVLCSVAVATTLFAIIFWNRFLPDPTDPESIVAIETTNDTTQTLESPNALFLTPVVSATSSFIPKTPIQVPDTPSPSPETPAVESATPSPNPDAEKLFKEGVAYEFNGDNANAFYYFVMAADYGHAEAQYKAGYYYHRGVSGIIPNPKFAFQYFQKSAEQGNRKGLLWTGWYYHYGVYVEQNYDIAYDYYVKARDQGHPEAQKRINDLRQARGY